MLNEERNFVERGMMIIYVSDFDLRGSGYMTISTNLCNELITKHQIGLVALGLGYDGREHHWPYTIVPVKHFSHVITTIREMSKTGVPIEGVVVALDIPLQEKIVKELEGKFPYIGIFPLEAPPLSMSWAMALLQMSDRLIMTKFGQNELEKQNISSTYIPISVNNIWRRAEDGEKESLQNTLGYKETDFVILTVADNQERKHLSRTAEVISNFAVDITKKDKAGYAVETKTKRQVIWNLVTRVDSPVGWDLNDLAMRLGLSGIMRTFNRGIPDTQLLDLFLSADVFLLTSKAEGLGLPVLEAMKCGLSVVATNCTAMEEHLAGDKGFLVECDYVHTDSFGNGNRYFASIVDGVAQLEASLLMTNEDMLRAAEDYVNERTWDDAGTILANSIKTHFG